MSQGRRCYALLESIDQELGVILRSPATLADAESLRARLKSLREMSRARDAGCGQPGTADDCLSVEVGGDGGTIRELS
jgi:hypothetical protein